MPDKNTSATNYRSLKASLLSTHEKFMARALQIAKNGLGTTAPNPMVGCVVVAYDRIVGEGFTGAYGGPHAEVNAINAVKDKRLLRAATLYVTLEPCSHFGKTPPCADLIVRSGIPNVVIGIKDPNEKVSGKGIDRLRAAGITVETGVLKEACAHHHRRFLTFQLKKRPYIILKWAQTLDGFMAPQRHVRSGEPKPYWISNGYSRQLAHKWRSEEQAILAGTNTVMEDNPRLDARLWAGKMPLRVVLDAHLKIPRTYNVYDDKVPTVIFTEADTPKNLVQAQQYVRVAFDEHLPSTICKKLYDQDIISIIIEGGAKTLQSFIERNLWDEARIFTGNAHFKNGIAAPDIKGRPVLEQNIEDDHLKILANDQEHHI